MGIYCSEVLADLPLFVGGDLEAPSRDAVTMHLETCTPCRDALAQASSARSVLSEHLERTAATPSGSVWPDVRERLRAEGLIQGQPLAAASAGGGRLLRFLPHAAAAAALLVAGVLSGQWLNSTDGPALLPGPGGSRSVPQVPAVSGDGGGALAERSPVEEGPRVGESVLHPMVDASPAVAEAETTGGLRAVEEGEALGGRASLFVEQPILTVTPFQANQMRMASFGQSSPQRPPSIDRTQSLLQRGIR